MSSPWVAYMGPFPFPWGAAASRRVLGLSQTLAATGLDVVIVSGDPCPHELTDFSAGSREHGAIRYVGVGEFSPSSASRMHKMKRNLLEWGDRSISWLESRPLPPTYIFVYGAHHGYLAKALKYGARMGIPVVADVVEWYSLSHLPGGWLGPFSLATVVGRTHYLKKCAGYVAISRQLDSRLARLNAPVVRVPPTVTDEGGSQGGCNELGAAPISLIFSGSAGRKDKLSAIMKGLADVPQVERHFRLSVVGPDPTEVAHLAKVARLPRSALEIYGRLDQREAIELVRSADYAVILRDPIPSNQMGFPTKFVEALSVGTPVVCNLTSDLSLYVVDGQTGWVVPSASTAAFTSSLLRIAWAHRDAHQQMRVAARELAERHFSPYIYTEPVARFLREVRP